MDNAEDANSNSRSDNNNGSSGNGHKTAEIIVLLVRILVIMTVTTMTVVMTVPKIPAGRSRTTDGTAASGDKGTGLAFNALPFPSSGRGAGDRTAESKHQQLQS